MAPSTRWARFTGPRGSARRVGGEHSPLSSVRTRKISDLNWKFYSRTRSEYEHTRDTARQRDARFAQRRFFRFVAGVDNGGREGEGPGPVSLRATSLTRWSVVWVLYPVELRTHRCLKLSFAAIWWGRRTRPVWAGCSYPEEALIFKGAHDWELEQLLGIGEVHQERNYPLRSSPELRAWVRARVCGRFAAPDQAPGNSLRARPLKLARAPSDGVWSQSQNRDHGWMCKPA